MAMITELNCNIREAVHVKYLDGNLFSQDVYGNAIRVIVMDGDEPATLAGTVSGTAIREDGSTVALTDSRIDENIATVVLPAAAYTVPGVLAITIKISDTNTVTTLAYVVANVYRTSTDTVVDPGTIIPSITSLIEQIAEAVASIPADYSSLWAALAETFNASKSGGYAVGEYVTYDGGLYRFKNAHTGSWSSSDVDAVNLGSGIAKNASDISDLKSAINYNDYLVPETFSTTYTRSASIKEEDGTNGTEGFRTGYIDYTKPMKISFNKPGETFVVWAYSNSSTSAETKISPTKKYVSGTVYLPLITTPIKRFRIGFHKDNGGTYTEEEAAASFAAVKFYSQTDKTLLLDNVPADAKVTGEKTTENRNDIDDILIRMGRKNWFNPNDADVVEGQFISGVSSGSEVWTENANYGETGFIPVQLGDKITFFYVGATAVSSPYKVYYNSAKEPISGSGTMPGNKYVTISDSSIKYIRIAFTIAKKDTLMVVKLTDQDATPYSPVGEVYVPYPNLTLPYIIKSTDAKIQNSLGAQWYGKSWYAYGTSITETDNASHTGKYVPYLVQMSGMTVTNRGHGGQGIGDFGATSTGMNYSAICKLTDGKANADLITLEQGANDVAAGVPLGTIYDTGRETSLAGCLNDCIRYLLENTSAQIVIMNSPYSKTMPTEQSQRFKWNEMMRQICFLNGVYFIDTSCGLGTARVASAQGSNYLVDNIHQTELGGYIYAEAIWNKLRNIPLFRTSIPN